MKVYLRTFGCRANHYDSEVARALAHAAGHEVVHDPSQADVAVFNSCAVTSEAERDLRKAVRRAAGANPALRSVVMGCASALPANRVSLGALPSVTALVSGADMAALAEALGVPPGATLRTVRQDSARAVLRIQDGCDEHCTFCATTIARGANRSRRVADLVLEAQQLADAHPEIVLTGTHIGTYGEDIGSSLGALVEELVRQVPRARLRLSSVEATEVDDRLADLLVSAPTHVAAHLHAPLQSGSDRVLKRMGRHWYTAVSYAAAIERLVSRVSVFGLGADIIVGFPGETEADYQETVALVERLPFTYLHVFSYSPRPGTAATRLGAAVPLGELHARSAHLRHLGQAKGIAYRAGRAGSRADVVAVTSTPRREGMTEDYLTVRIDGDVPRGTRFRGVLRSEGESHALTCHPEERSDACHSSHRSAE